jgi:hypothetical protein
MKNLSDKMLITQAAALGVSTITKDMLGVLKAAAENPGDSRYQQAAAIVRANINKEIQAILSGFDAIKTASDKAAGGGGGGAGGANLLSKEAKLVIARLQKELDALKTKRDIINETNNELKRQYDYQQKLMQLSQDAVQAKISGNYIGANILEQQKSFETGQFNKETDALALDKKITDLENKISAMTADVRVTNAKVALDKARAKGKSMGGLIKGPGTTTSDSIMARVGYASGGLIGLSNNEYVVKAATVQKYGVGFMDAINNQKISPVDTSTASSSGNTVYNIDMTINAANGNANDIADQVIRKLKVETSKNNKSNAVMM